jgi:hypothetical protein
MHLQPESVAARAALEGGQVERAFRALIAPGDEPRAARFQEAARSDEATYRELVDLLGDGFEGGYFLHRFSDPSFLVASAVIRAVAGTVLRDGGRAVDLCAGSGHLSRALAGVSAEPPVTADLYFAKVWLASRRIEPGCEPICCDANAPLPFARGAFRLALCADAFMYIWTKRQLVSEMSRLIEGDGPGSVVITHAHNDLVWSPSHGQPLPPNGYMDLFETLEPTIFSEAGLLDDVVAGGPLDLSRRDEGHVLAADPALTIIASRDASVFRPHPLARDLPPRGVLRINPLYEQVFNGREVHLRLRFPSGGYEEEYGACRRYLAEEVTLDRDIVDAVGSGSRSPQVVELVRRQVVLDVPERYC